ncbi:MAG: histidine phosphatase family protein [Chloroflexota bacterium]
MLLVRHAVSAATPGRYWGSSDPPLSALGRRQSLALARRLEGWALAAVFSSDLRRAAETAALATAGRDVPTYSRPLLRELDFGLYEGLTYTEALDRSPAAGAFFLGEDAAVAAPGGESLADLVRRVGSFVAEVSARPATETLMVVSHGGPLRLLLCLAFGLDPRQHWRWRVDHSSLSILQLGQGPAVLNLLNDTCHLAGMTPER